MSAEDLTIPDEQRGRQAVASLGGYIHQILSSALAWVGLGPDEILLIEVAEDYAVLARNALQMTQVKRETSNIALTLRREDARKAILSLWQFRIANPGRDVRLNFLTTARVGVENGSGFPEGASGIAWWARAALGADVEPLRDFLLSLEWPDNLAQFLRTASPETLRSDLFGRITWLSDTDPTSVLLDSLAARLGVRATSQGMLASDGERALPLLVLRLLETVLAPDRRLTLREFEAAWEKATTIPMPFNLARQMLGQIGTTSPTETWAELALEALPPRLARRAAIVDRLAETMMRGEIPWIHGSSGLGKSRLAALLAARSNGPWHVVRLRGLQPADIRQDLRRTIAALDRPGLAGIVLDDLPIPLPEQLRPWVRALALQAAALDLKLVATSERAPLAPINLDFAPWRLTPLAAPYLAIEDVAEIIVAAGGDSAQWAQIVHLTCGAGHPLFVDARVAGLASRGWPRTERMSGLLDATGLAEVEEVRAGIALRLLNELESDSHSLLLRLSVMIGPFDRELAMAVADAHRPLTRPGVMLDYLIGPWIEPTGQDRFKLSPLLASAGATGLGEAERDAVRAAIVDHLISRRPLSADLLSQVLFQSLAARHLKGLNFVAGAVLTSDHRQAIARSCIALGFLTSKADGRLVPEHHGISASLRLAQVIAVCFEPDHVALETVLSEADAEFALMPEPVASGSRFTMLLSLLANEEVNASPRVWMPRLLEYVGMVEGGRVPAEMAEGIGKTDLGGLREDEFFFVLRTNRMRNVADLAELFEVLEAVDTERRRQWFVAGTTLLGGPPLFVQTAWSRPATDGNIDAPSAVATYQHLAERAESWGEATIAIECHRSAAILLDEYMDAGGRALEQLDAAEVRHPGDSRIARTRAGILARAGRHAEAHAILEQLANEYSHDEPLERALMLQAAAASAARTGERLRAADLFLEAYAASDGVTSLEEGVRIGLLCDAVVELGAAQQWELALRVWADAHLAAEAIVNDTNSRSWVAVQAVSQVAQWLNATHELRESLALQDHPGTWSTLKPNLPEDRSGAVGLDVGLACGALLEDRLQASIELVARFEARARDGGVSPLASLALRSGQLSSAVDRRDFLTFRAMLPLFIAASLAALDIREGRTPRRPSEPVPPASDWQEREIGIVRVLASEFLVELLLDGQSLAAVQVAEKLVQDSEGLAGLLDDRFASSDYCSAAVGAVRWLKQPGIPDSGWITHVSFSLFQWLSTSTRPSLRARIWPLLEQSWRNLIDSQPHLQDLSNRTALFLEAALNAEGKALVDYAVLVFAGASATGTPLPDQAMAALSRAMSSAAR